MRRYLGTWELGSIIFHTAVYKLFLSVSLNLSWLSVLLGGLLFLAVLAICLRFYKPTKGKLYQFYSRTVGIYWIFSGAYVLKSGAVLLQKISFFQSPLWFLMLFLLLGALIPALYGKSAVYRLHALTVTPIAFFLFVLALLGITQGRWHNLFPVLPGNGFSPFQQSINTLFLYLDIPFLFHLLSDRRQNLPDKKIIFTASVLGVVWNLLLTFVLNLQFPYGTPALSPSPLYTLAKSGIVPELLFLLSLIPSLILYLTLSLHLVSRIRILPKKIPLGILCLVCCLLLSGCYDSREVEETAYLTAIGIDRGEDSTYQYTFQISNPLKTGSSEQSSQVPPEMSQQEENQGVAHLTAEEENIYPALSGLRSRLGKEPDLSHLKVIIFSKELAKDGIYQDVLTLANLPKLRLDANLCLADSANKFLTGVRPTLEESTPRYYRLMFQQQYSPYAPTCTLKDTISYISNPAKDPVLPISSNDCLEGLGIFQGDALVLEGDAYQAGLYRMLSGTATNLTITSGTSVFALSSKAPPIISYDTSVSPPQITVTPQLKALLLSGTLNDSARLTDSLTSDMSSLLQKASLLGADMLGLSEHAPAPYSPKTILPQASIFVKPRIFMEK